MERKHFDVANLTLQTLVNTYPESAYAAKGRVVLGDPEIANCGESWNCSWQCSGRPGNTPSD
jgi:hypothetical protein